MCNQHKWDSIPSPSPSPSPPSFLQSKFPSHLSSSFNPPNQHHLNRHCYLLQATSKNPEKIALFILLYYRFTHHILSLLSSFILSLPFFPTMPSSPPPPPPPPQPPSSSSSSTPPQLLSLSFNQDSTCFSAATNSGFLIFNTHPFRPIFNRTFSHSLSLVHMLFRCNILALVGGGPHPNFPPHKVMLWDDHRCCCIGELSFRSDVKSVRLRRDRIVVVLLHKIFVYNFADLKLLHQIETVANPKGLCEVSCLSNSIVLVCPGLQKGQIRVEHYGSKRTKFVMAHDSRIASMALTQDGRLVATASSKGTLVRVFNTLDGSLLQEVRRGTDRAEIQSLAFSSNARWLAASSDRGTIHVFNLKLEPGSPGNSGLQSPPEQPSSPRSPISSISFMKGVLPKYFSSEWSMAQFHLQEGTQYIVSFGQQENTVVIVGMDGSFYRCEFDPESGGEMRQLEYRDFLKPEQTSES